MNPPRRKNGFTVNSKNIEFVINWIDENIDNHKIQNEDYATLIRNFGWDLAYLAIAAKYGENEVTRIDKAYSNYIMGL